MSKVLEAYTSMIESGLVIKPDLDPVKHCAMGLAGEAGEVVDLYKKAEYLAAPEGAPDPNQVLLELGDALWYLTNLASRNGATLEQLALLNIQKLAKRHPDRYSFEYLMSIVDEEVKDATDLEAFRAEAALL